MKRIISFFAVIMLVFISCTDDLPTETKSGKITFTSKQIPMCDHMVGDDLQKIQSQDSSFYYNFSDTLDMLILVSGNCCPDTNRFIAELKISNDTIFTSISDTAKDGCYCNCYYFYNLKIVGLEMKPYIFHCDYPPIYSSNDTVKYREDVIPN